MIGFSSSERENIPTLCVEQGREKQRVREGGEREWYVFVVSINFWKKFHRGLKQSGVKMPLMTLL